MAVVQKILAVAVFAVSFAHAEPTVDSANPLDVDNYFQQGDDQSAELRYLSANGTSNGTNSMSSNATTTTTMDMSNVTTTTTMDMTNVTTTTTMDPNITTTTTGAITTTTTADMTNVTTTTTMDPNATTTTMMITTTTTPMATTTTMNDTNATTGAAAETYNRSVSMGADVSVNCTQISGTGDCAANVASTLMASDAAKNRLCASAQAAFSTTSDCSVTGITGTLARLRLLDTLELEEGEIVDVEEFQNRRLTMTSVTLDITYAFVVTAAEDTALQTAVTTADTTTLTTLGADLKTALETDAGLTGAVGTVTASAPVVGAATGANAPSTASTTSAAFTNTPASVLALFSFLSLLTIM